METDFKRWTLLLCFVLEEMRSCKPPELWHTKVMSVVTFGEFWL